jgi:hypothetical protein
MVILYRVPDGMKEETMIEETTMVIRTVSLSALEAKIGEGCGVEFAYYQMVCAGSEGDKCWFDAEDCRVLVSVELALEDAVEVLKLDDEIYSGSYEWIEDNKVWVETAVSQEDRLKMLKNAEELLAYYKALTDDEVPDVLIDNL